MIAISLFFTKFSQDFFAFYRVIITFANESPLKKWNELAKSPLKKWNEPAKSPLKKWNKQYK